MDLTPELAVDVARRVLACRAEVASVTVLRGSDRSLVARVVLDGADSVVVKLHKGDGDSSALVREPAALELVAEPRLLGVSDDPPAVVMEDLRTEVSLADALLGNDAALARSRMTAWAEALARSQVESDGFPEALQRHAQRLGQPVPAADATARMLAAAAEALPAQLEELGLEPAAAALDELSTLDGLLGGDVRRLTPTDACPDNNVWLGDRLVLIDYEAADLRHVAWDVAYLRVPWPSCWCSWAVPQDVADQALVSWKLAFHHPYVQTDAFEEDLRTATLGWAFVTLWWFGRRAVGERPGPPPELQMPSARARLLHRFGHAPEVPQAPALTQLARDVHAALVDRWDPEPLLLAPAFRAAAS